MQGLQIIILWTCLKARIFIFWKWFSIFIFDFSSKPRKPPSLEFLPWKALQFKLRAGEPVQGDFKSCNWNFTHFPPWSFSISSFSCVQLQIWVKKEKIIFRPWVWRGTLIPRRVMGSAGMAASVLNPRIPRESEQEEPIISPSSSQHHPGYKHAQTRMSKWGKLDNKLYFTN